jgi:septum site-determining protein MinD
MGKAVLICSGKGGVGKTTITVNLGVCLALRGIKTCILDFNTGLRNNDIYLGLEDSILFDLADAASGLCKLEKAITKHDIINNLYLLSGPQYREIEGVTGSHIRVLLARLKKEFDIVLVDMAVTAGKRLEHAAVGADEAIIVVTPDYASVRNGDTVSKKLANVGLIKRYYVINLIHQDAFGDKNLPDIEFMIKNVAAECLGAVPYDLKIHIANNSGMPIASRPGVYPATEFEKIAMRLL